MKSSTSPFGSDDSEVSPVSDVLLLTVTVTSTVEPATPGGEVALQVVRELHETLVAAAVPKSTVVLPVVVSKPVPVIVTTVPPAAGPVVVSRLVTVGPS